MIDYKALREQCRREGKSTLDLDDLAAGHPVAEAELAEYARLRMAVDNALASFHLTTESFDTPEQALDELLKQERGVAEFFARPSFGSPGALADWLERLHGTTPDGAVCANKWEPAQIAAKAVRGQASPPAPAAVPENVLESLWRHTRGIDPETGKAWLTPRMMADAERLKTLLDTPAPAEPDPITASLYGLDAGEQSVMHSALLRSSKRCAEADCAGPEEPCRCYAKKRLIESIEELRCNPGTDGDVVFVEDLESYHALR